MADAIIYCDRCGRMIQPAELSRGQAIATGRVAICSSCAAGLAPEERAALAAMARSARTRTPVPARTPSARLGVPPPAAGAVPVRPRTPAPSGRPSARAAEPGPGRGSATLALAAAGVAAGVAVGVAVVLLVMSGGNQAPPAPVPQFQPAPSPAPGPASAPPGTSEAPAAAARPVALDAAASRRHLEAVRAAIDPSLGRYDEIRSELVRLREALAGSPEAEEAAKLLAELDERHAELGESALKSASEAADDLVRRGRFDEAVSVLNSLRPRFGGSVWFETRGERELAAALSRIAEARSAGQGTVGRNVFADGSFDVVDGRGIPSGWSVPAEWVASAGPNRWLRLSNDDPKNAPNVVYRFPVDPAWETLKVSARIKATGLKPGKENWHTGRVALRFEDEKNEMVGQYGPVPELRADSDWTLREVTMTVPAGAHHLNVQPALFHATGTVEFDDIQIVPLSLRPAPTRAPAAAAPAGEEMRPEPSPAPAPAVEVPPPSEEPWPLFLVEFVAAARAGLEEAKALVERESPRLAELVPAERLARLRLHLREAGLVHEIALDGLRNAAGMVRLQRQGRPVSGKVAKVEGGVLTLKPSVGEPVDIPIAEIAPADLVQAAGLLRLGSVEPVRVAQYLLARGDIAQARRLVASEPGPKALALREELDEIASALERAEARERRAKTPGPLQRPEAVGAPAAAPRPAFALRVNCGPNQFEVPGWERDDPWVSGGADFTFGSSPDVTGVAGAAPPEVYRTCRHQNHSYNFSSVPNGNYTVRLHFYDEHGQGRRMDYTIEGVKVLDGFSTRPRELAIREFAVTVSDGNGLQIVAEQDDGNDVFECGIEIFSAEAPEGGGYVRGLLGEYFQGTERDPAMLKLTRIDPQVDFDWKTGSPAPEIAPDNFSARWTGEIEVPARGRYEFEIRRDNGFALWIGGRRIFEKLDQGHGIDHASADLEAGWQPIRIEFLEGGGDAYARLSWKGPGFDMKVVPPESFRTRSGAPGEWTRTENFDSVADGTRPPQGWSLGADWRIDRGALVSGSSQATFAAPLAPNGKAVTLEVTLTVEETLPQGGHKVAGPAVYLDERNYWGAALVEAPDGSRYIELCEMLDGEWLAQVKEPFKLSATHHGGLGWEPRHPYRLRLEMDPEGITASFSELDGKTLASIGYRFDKRAVTSGRPALKSGGFRARFDDFTAKVRTDGPAAIAPPPTPPLPGGPKEPLPGETGEPGQWAPGLICELFSDHGFRNRIGVRIDPAVDMHFGDGPVDLDGPSDNFAVRWSGWLLVPQDGQYTIKLDVDDVGNMTLDGRPFLSSKNNQSQTQTRRLDAGLHSITVTLLEYGGGAFARLQWQTPMLAKTETIPAGYFYHRVPELGEMGPFAKLERGVWAEYFLTDAFDRKVAEGPLDRLDFDAGDLPPHPLLPKDRSGVRMRGYLLSRWSKDMKFEAEGGGVRLRLGGRTVIDSLRSAVKASGSAAISHGYNEFELEYADLGDTRLVVRWDADGMRTIDANWLFRRPGRRRTVDRSGLAPGLLGRLYAGENPGGKAVAEFLEPSCTFDWSGREPAPGLAKNRFSGAWRGVLLVPQTGQYMFVVRHSGGVALSVGGTPVVNKWSSVTGLQSGVVALRAGRAPLMLTYFNREGDAKLDCWWSGPLFGFRRLSSEALAHQAQELPMARPWEEEPRAKPGEPAAPVAAGGTEASKPEPMPAGNLVVNGTFEALSEDGRFAERWTAHQWGPGSPAYVARIDRGNAHAGERALLVQATGDGALPGAFTSLPSALTAGSYTLRFWACADVGKSAQVHANVAGRDVGPFQVGEDWKEIVAQIDLAEKKLGATLRLWTSSARVRVWFDDVSLEAKSPAPPAR